MNKTRKCYKCALFTKHIIIILIFLIISENIYLPIHKIFFLSNNLLLLLNY